MKESCYQQSKEEVFAQLQSRETGLTSEEVIDRRERCGWNELTDGKKKSAIQIFAEQFKDVLVIILIVAAIISAVLGDISSSLVILVVITMNAILGMVQQIKAKHSLDSLKQMTTPTAKVMRDGEICVMSSKEVVPGDIVVLEAGDSVCADGRIIYNASLKVNESALTGESESVEKEEKVIDDIVTIGDRKNMVFAGSFITYGRATFIVTSTAMDTEVGKIAMLLKETQEKKTPLQKSLDNFGTKLAIAIIAICILIFGLSVIRGETIMNSFMFAVALAVAAIPEALSSIVTIVLAFSTQKMVKENAIIRNLQAVEGLGSVSIICSDKTGTLTQNKMTVQKYYVNHTLVNGDDADFSRRMDRKLLYASIICNDASNNEGVEIGDPTEVALVNFANAHGVTWRGVRGDYGRFGEIPFDSDRKLMSVAYNPGNRLCMVTKGALDVLLERVTDIEVNDGVRPITDEDKDQIKKANLEFSSSGLRVLAFGMKCIEDSNVNLDDEYNLTFIGLVAMMDPPREESKAAVEKCISAGIRPIMITGDHKITAQAIAEQIGIISGTFKAVDGMEIDALTDEQLKEEVPNISVYARVSPEHKIRIVRAWQERGNIVSMTGDGVNDAPALKQADVGVAMGITGTEVAKDAASMILTDDNFATIVKAIENGRNVYRNIKKSIKFLLSGNMAGILTVVYASIAGLAVPFAPVHLLFINLLTDSLPAIALGLDPHSSDVMQEKPRPQNESIMTKDFMIGVIGEGIVIGINTMIAYYIGLQSGPAMASTMAFATLCLSRLVHGFNTKSERPVIFTKQMWNNRFLNGAFVAGFVLLNAVLFIPGLSTVFKVEALGFSRLMVIYLCAIMNLFEIQILKWIKSYIKK